MQRRDTLLAVAVLLSTLTAAPELYGQAADPTAVEYNRAERFLSWHAETLVSGDQVRPEWMEDGQRFWYRNRLGEGHEFIFVDPGTATRRQLFDHHRLAAAMSVADDTAYVGTKLPFDDFDFVDELESIEFEARKQRFVCDIVQYACAVGDTLATTTPYVESPDGRWEAFVVDYDLYIRPAGGGDSTRVTTDGEEFYSYGLTYPRPNQVKSGNPRRPSVSWSPDSRRLVVARQDERDVEHHHYLSMTPQRPVHYSAPYALPGDSIIPYPALHVITLDVPAADDGDGGDAVMPTALSNFEVEFPDRPLQSSFAGSVPDSAWSDDGSRVYVTSMTRAYKDAYLTEVDVNSGAARVLAHESVKTYYEFSHGQRLTPASWYVMDDGDVLWWSQRDGWAHLYLLGPDGETKRQITSGPWVASLVRHVDEDRGHIYFDGRGREDGRNVYYRHLYRVNLDGSGLTLLTPEDADHTITWSPSGDFFVDSYSRVEAPPVTVLRAKPDGRVVTELERADISRMVEEIDFRPAEVFSVKARDGITDLYGIIYFPPDFDPEAKYPIITHIYPGPQVGSVRRWGWTGNGEDFALAQLGFVVIQLDHLGTPNRSKAFHDNYYGDFNDNGLPDHVTAIQQLAARHPFIDLDRVGIYGHSGGGFATTDAMFRFPDFFHVGVAGAGNHDNASYNIYWSEKYQGELTRDSLTNETNFAEEANKAHAANLRGKLLLMHGDMDDNVHPAMTTQVINELIKENKDFDLIIAPDRAHGLNEPYFIRRRWDYFVEHLLGAEPPQEYKITKPEGS
jgi:dipeptidyl aminopeptidase/acylaminoacyl peptidase